jgi:hypothetical protein
MRCDFTLEHYRFCLEQAYVTNTNGEITYDIDYPPHNLLRVAEIERTIGFTTKYFVRLPAKYHNALSFDSIQIFKSLAHSFGHEIGPHCEAGYYQSEKIGEAIVYKTDILAKALECPILYFSLHAPAKCGTIVSPSISSSLKYYCYDSPYYAGKKYICDSGGRWREGCFCSHIGRHNALIVVMHPNWWFEKTPAENY